MMRYFYASVSTKTAPILRHACAELLLSSAWFTTETLLLKANSHIRRMRLGESYDLFVANHIEQRGASIHHVAFCG